MGRQSVQPLTRFSFPLAMFLRPVSFQALRSINIQPMDVLYFVHDSAPYMAAAGDRLRVVLGYKNLIHLPCWAHLLDVVGSVVFNQQVLPEYSEYIRLNRCAIHAFFFFGTQPLVFQASLCAQSPLEEQVDATSECYVQCATERRPEVCSALQVFVSRSFHLGQERNLCRSRRVV